MQSRRLLAVGILVLAFGFALEMGAQTLSGPVRPEGVAAAYGLPPAQVMIGRKDVPPLRIAPPANFAEQPKTATFSIQYLNAGDVNYFGDVCVGWPEAAKTTFTYAANVWGTMLNSSVPTVISACWANMGTGGVLGHGGARSYHMDFSGAPLAGTYYPVAIANALHGSDLNGSDEEIVIAYNAQFTDWYFGTDGACPSDKIDFCEVIMHEMCHGLGFIGSMSVNGGLGSWSLGDNVTPVIYDRFAENGSAQKLIDTSLFPNGSVALANQLTSDSVYFGGPNATAGNGGVKVKLYCPTTWKPGSSYAHLDQIFNNTPNSMMTYSVNYGSAVHDPGPVTSGLLRDIGWTVSGSGPTPSIYVNGSSAAAITLTTSDPINLAISMQPGSSAGVNKDWWIAAITSGGIYYFSAYSMTWLFAADLSQVQPSYQGALFTLTPVSVLSLPSLPAGVFQFYFGVDAMNSVIDPDIVYSTIKVTVQ